MARPSTRGVKLKNGFYIEVRNKGAHSGVKIRRDSAEEAQLALHNYSKMHDVHYIGEVENGKVVGAKKERKKKAPKK
jgi:hypothetical protein